MSPWNPFKQKEDPLLREVIMLENLHGDAFELDTSLVPPDPIVRHLVELRPVRGVPGVTILPYSMDGEEIRPEAMLLNMELQRRGIALAYSENPRVLYVDPQALSDLRQNRPGEMSSLLQTGNWRYLLRVLWSAGLRLAKIEFLDSDVDIQTFEP